MAVNYNAISESHTGTTGSTNESSFSWSHTPTGSASKGVLIFTFMTGSTSDETISVTYGGINVPAVSSGRVVSGLGLGAQDCKAWYLGSGVPQGTGSQTVVVNRNNNANVIYAIAVTFDANTNTYVYASSIVTVNSGDDIAPKVISDGQSSGPGSCRVAAINVSATDYPSVRDTVLMQDVLYTGATPPSVVTNSMSIDLGSSINAGLFESSASVGSATIGWDWFDAPPNSKFVAAIHFAIRESIPVPFASPAFSNSILVNEQWMGSRSPLFP